MDTLQKLQILSDASQYDLACSCGSNSQDRRKRGTGGAWLYPVSVPSGGNAVMLKTLMSNVCRNDCGYCPYREAADTRRCTIGPDEMAKFFLEYEKRNNLIGIFLSSGVVKSADYTMSLLNDTARILRKKYSYNGYVHLKIIPGASDAAIDDSLSLANVVSLNIETPGLNHFVKLSSSKNYIQDIINPLKRISNQTAKGAKYSHVGTTTQFIVGASDETDAEIVKYAAGLYDKLSLSRIYFSAYQRGLGDKRIPGECRSDNNQEGAFVREHRLYQVDFLLRKYSFTANDIYFDSLGGLFADRDPKLVWAQNHPEYFPLNVNRATKKQLLKVPGLGPESVRKIFELRKHGRISGTSDLPLKGKRLECAKQYVVCS